MKIYLSSTYSDLRDYRSAVDVQLRSMGHDVVGMEQYVAESSTPLGTCLADVRSANFYMIIVAWSYGFIPDDEDLNPQKRSITELELEEAEKAQKPVLAFLLDPEAPWPPILLDPFKVQAAKIYCDCGHESAGTTWPAYFGVRTVLRAELPRPYPVRASDNKWHKRS